MERFLADVVLEL